MASTATFALATALTARTDSPHAAAHQICLQLWLASSLLADALAVAAQTLLARSVAAGNTAASQQIAQRVLRWGVLLGVFLAAALGLSSRVVPTWFTKDAGVLTAISAIYPWVFLTQPINALAFVWDGVLYVAARSNRGPVIAVVKRQIGCLTAQWSAEQTSPLVT